MENPVHTGTASFAGDMAQVLLNPSEGTDRMAEETADLIGSMDGMIITHAALRGRHRLVDALGRFYFSSTPPTHDHRLAEIASFTLAMPRPGGEGATSPDYLFKYVDLKNGRYTTNQSLIDDAHRLACVMRTTKLNVCGPSELFSDEATYTRLLLDAWYSSPHLWRHWSQSTLEGAVGMHFLPNSCQ